MIFLKLVAAVKKGDTKGKLNRTAFGYVLACSCALHVSSLKVKSGELCYKFILHSFTIIQIQDGHIQQVSY